MQTFTVVLCTLIALATAQTSTEAPVRDDVTVTSTFVGDLATATPAAQAGLIAEVDAAVAAVFEVPIADVATTLSSGSIIATSVVTAPTVVAYTAPVILSTGFGAATVVITDNGSDRMGPGSGDRASEGGKSGGNGEAGGMGMGYSEGGKGGKGAGAEGGKGGSGKGQGEKGGKGKGSEGGSGEKGGKGQSEGGKGTFAGLSNGKYLVRIFPPTV